MEPSPWVRRFAGLIAAGGSVLDIACGGGRHTRLFRDRGHPVTAVDRDLSGVADLAGDARVTLVEADLEDGGPPPFAGRRFAGVVVTNYLHRPLLPALIESTEGVLLYETFARGQEAHGRPTNPDWLLRPGELLDAVRGALRVVAYEDVVEPVPSGGLAARQRVCAVASEVAPRVEPLV